MWLSWSKGLRFMFNPQGKVTYGWIALFLMVRFALSRLIVFYGDYRPIIELRALASHSLGSYMIG